MGRRFSRFYEFLLFCLLFFFFLLMCGSIIKKSTNDLSQSKITNFFSANPVGDACIDDYDGDKVPDVDDECPHVKHISKTNFRDYFTIDLFPGHPEPSPEWRVAKMVTIFKLMSVLLLRFRQRQACIIRSYLILCTFSALFRNFFFFFALVFSTYVVLNAFLLLFTERRFMPVPILFSESFPKRTSSGRENGVRN